MFVELSTPLDENLLQLLNALKRAIRHRFPKQGPQPLGGLKLGRIRRLKHQMNIVGNDQAWGGVTGCTIQQHHQLTT